MSKQAGFSLIELLVAAMLALFVLGGLITLALLGGKIQGMHNQHARLQENARFAIELLLRDLRMAGYFGCVHDAAKVHNRLNHTAGGLIDVNHGLEGFEHTQTSWSPSGSSEKIQEMSAHSDGITLRFANPSARAAITESMATADSEISRPNNSDWRAGDILVISDCDSADLLQVDSLNGGGIAANKLSRAYAAGAELTSLWAARYFIAPSTTNGLPTLKRQLLQGGGHTTTEELAQGVDDLQFLFGEDTDLDGLPDVYRQAHLVKHWPRVVTVQVGLLLRSLQEFGAEADTAVHQILDHTFDDPNDLRVRRRVLHYTVALRNARSGS